MMAIEAQSGDVVVIVDENIRTPPASPQVNTGDVVTINKVDGMYCQVHHDNGEIAFIAVWTEVEEM